MPIQPKQQAPYYTNTNAPKTYKIITTQSGTDNPTKTEIINTTDLNPTFTRIAQGLYRITATDLFTIGKTSVLTSPLENGYMQQSNTGNNDTIDIISADINGTPQDDMLNNTTILITVNP